MAAQLHVAGVVSDLWIAVFCTEIQKISSHCSDAFCYVGNVCVEMLSVLAPLMINNVIVNYAR